MTSDLKVGFDRPVRMERNESLPLDAKREPALEVRT
jgi:hypothetical protein